MKYTNETYDVLKLIALIILPAVATLYAGISELWGLPFGTEIPGTINLVSTFLGVSLIYSSKNYKEETLEGNE